MSCPSGLSMSFETISCLAFSFNNGESSEPLRSRWIQHPQILCCFYEGRTQQISSVFSFIFSAPSILLLKCIIKAVEAERSHHDLPWLVWTTVIKVNGGLEGLLAFQIIAQPKRTLNRRWRCPYEQVLMVRYNTGSSLITGFAWV